MYNLVLSINWTPLYEVPSVEIACDKFYEILINLLEITVPKYRNSKNSHSYPPWFNTEVISCLRTKFCYFKRYKKYGTNQFYDMFKQYRARSKVLIDASFRAYINIMQNKKILELHCKFHIKRLCSSNDWTFNVFV